MAFNNFFIFNFQGNDGTSRESFATQHDFIDCDECIANIVESEIFRVNVLLLKKGEALWRSN